MRGKIVIIESVFMHWFDVVAMSTTGCPWTLQGPADWQSSTGLQEEVRHLHRACAERKGQWNYSSCWNSPQQGKTGACILGHFAIHFFQQTLETLGREAVTLFPIGDINSTLNGSITFF